MKLILLPFKIFLFITFFVIAKTANAQILISGAVYDTTKVYGVKEVIVKSTGGASTLTDSTGMYHLNVNETDSISFIYQNKPTVKFPVKSIINYNQFDISLRVRIFEKYKPLKEVIVYSKSYRQDSIENRLEYAKIFNSQKPVLHTTFTDGEPPGLDLDQLINVFHFRRNKQNIAFQKRLLQEEQDKYVSYRFNSTLLKRVTGLSGTLLETYKATYRPSYDSLINSTELEFYEYILNTSYQFKKMNALPVQ